MQSSSSSSSSSPSSNVGGPSTVDINELDNGNENQITSSNAKNIFQYLLTLSTEDLDALYTGHANTCKAMFRNLPPLAKHFVLRLILFERPVPMVNLVQLLSKSQEANEKWKEALDSLLRSRIMMKSTNHANNAIEIQLNPKFRETFSQCMRSLDTESDTMQESMGNSGGDATTEKLKNKNLPSLEFLHEFSKDRWESVLKYMVGVTDPKQVDPGVKKLLEWSGLAQPKSRGVKEENGYDYSDDMMDDGDGDGDHSVSSAGFSFMLLDTQSQVWTLLREYINTAHNRQQKKNEILQFLFELSFSLPGRSYMVKQLTKTQKVALRDFVSMFGLVYMRKEKSKFYYPTPLSTGILSNTFTPILNESIAEDSEGETQQGYIIVETSYRVYAYTNSALQIALLSLFVALEYNTPNMVVGMITRESIRIALMLGIDAEQILGFLYLHAHPRMKMNKPVIPDTVADQIRLWEEERNRVKMYDAYVYQEFPNAQAFLLVEKYAKELGALLWSSREKLMLSCRTFAHEKIKEYIRKFV